MKVSLGGQSFKTRLRWLPLDRGANEAG
ncbi:hypothetical protein HaLaN_00236 [Haematococcus lacustris]|uniref:Uncharacterized protein n=1 Tax=Haematococcus lacustris TaxID=44745 RepID=A0A699YD07_HAELA|nr:hypothetical protein HaLaN_00236 [Haematococcus lacustris]